MKALVTSSVILVTLLTGCGAAELASTKDDSAASSNNDSMVADCYNDLYIVEPSETASQVLFANGACKNGADRHSDWQTVRIMALQKSVFVNDAFSVVDRASSKESAIIVKDNKAYVSVNSQQKLIGSVEQIEGRYPTLKPASGVCVSLAINDDPYALESNSKDYAAESKHIFVHFSSQCR